MDQLLAISGNRKGTRLYLWQERAYYIRQTRKTTTYLACQAYRKMNCQAWLKVDNASASINLLKPHAETCPVNQSSIDALAAKSEMKSIAEAGTSGNSLKQIFRSTAAKHQVSARLSYHSLESTLRKRKALTMPAIPGDAVKATEAIMGEAPECYRANVVQTINGDSGQAIIFVSKQMAAAVQRNGVSFIQADATYAITPAIFYQTLTIMCEIGGIMMPCAYALMTNKTQSLYLRVFEEFKIALSNGDAEGSLRPAQAVVDYEPAVARALELIFPDTRLNGCLFHYTKNVLKRHRELRLTKLYFRNHAYKRWFRLLLSLPLLPEHSISSFYQEELAKKNFDCEGWESRAVKKLKRYLESHWLRQVGPGMLSVFHLKRRTTNETESHNRWIRRQIPPVSAKHNLWFFVQRLNEFMAEVDLDLERLSNGLLVRRQKSKRRVALEERLEELKRSLNEGQMSPLDYLLEAKSKVPLPEPSPEEAGNADKDDESDDSEDDVGGEAADNDKENKPPSCQVCGHGAVEVILLPCQHARFCLACSDKMEECASCGVPVAQRLEILL